MIMLQVNDIFGNKHIT